MKTQCMLQSWPRLAAMLLILVIVLGTRAQAAPIPLPEWAKPIESQLPKISPEIVSEIDDLYTYWYQNKEVYTPDVRKKYNEVAFRLVELRDYIGPAMIWQYLKDDGLTRNYNQLLLLSLNDDRDLAVSLLPVIRCRMVWLKQLIQNPNFSVLKKNMDYHWQIDEIQSFLYAHGEDEDLKTLDQLMEEDVKHGSRVYSNRKSLQEQARGIQEARAMAIHHNKPFWFYFANHLIDQGLLSEDIKQSALRTNDNKQHADVLKSPQSAPSNIFSTSWLQPWMIWSSLLLVLGAGSAVLIRGRFRKPKN
jgi:hypothetical protein